MRSADGDMDDGMKTALSFAVESPVADLKDMPAICGTSVEIASYATPSGHVPAEGARGGGEGRG